MRNIVIHSAQMEVENQTYQAKLHWTSYVVPLFYTVIGSLGVLPLFIMKGTFQIIALMLTILLAKGILQILKRRSMKIYVTEGLISISFGIFSKTIIDLSLKKMEGMHLHQSLIGKALNYGTLNISTGEITQSFTINNPEKLREIINDKLEL